VRGLALPMRKRRGRSLIAGGADSGATKDEFIASEPAAAGPQPLKDKAALAAEIEHRFRRGYLEGPSTDPIDHVAPGRHATLGTIAAPGAQRIAARGVTQHCRSPEPQRGGPQDEKTQPLGQAIVKTLDARPISRSTTLVVVDRQSQHSVGGDAAAGHLDGAPHLARVVQHAPGIDQIESAELRDIAAIEDRA